MSAKEKVIKWKNYGTHFRRELKTLCVNGDFVDVTLWCERQTIQAHKCILAAVSPYFRLIFKEAPTPHPIVVFKNVAYEDLFYAINYIYDGTVKLKQPRWRPFFEVATMLGLSIDANELLTVAVNEEPVNEPAAVELMAPLEVEESIAEPEMVIGKRIVFLLAKKDLEIYF